jgi:hypothetical protein
MDSSEQATNDLMELAALHGTLLSKLTQIGTGTGYHPGPGVPNPHHATTVVTRPWITPPEGHLSYDSRSKVALPAVGGNAIIVTIQSPEGYDGVINQYSWNFLGGGFVQASGDIVVRLLRDNAPIRNYDNVTVEAGTIGIARVVNPIRVYSRQIIQLQVLHVANGLLAGDVVASLAGYYYPSMG